jgi:formiminoglutamase
VDPEDGPDAIRLHQLVKPGAKRALIGFACDAGVKRNKGRVGAKDGPAALRQALANLAAPQNAVVFSDLGDVAVTGDALEAGQEVLAIEIADALSQHERLVVLGGGHETAFASYQGLRKRYPDARIGILNLDAHLDLRLPGEAGGSSGTPFAQIRALDPDRFDYLCVGYAEEANTGALLKRAQDWDVGLVRDHDLIADPLAAHDGIAALIARNDLIYLTIDIDVLSHCQAPGVSAPAARGVPLSTIEQIVGFALTKAGARLALADLVELCPVQDQDGVTAKTAALLARRLLMNV